MRILIAGLIAVLFMTTASVAEAPINDDVRRLLDTEDYAGLERVIGEMHGEALENKAFGEIRGVFKRIFDAAHSVRLTKVQKWRDAYPDSHYAAAAVGWMHRNRAHLLRGESLARFTPRGAMGAFHNELLLARDALDRVDGRKSDFLPLVDLAIALELTHLGDNRLLDHVEHALGVSPERYTVLKAMDSLQLVWGGSPDEIVALCAKYADRVPGYGREPCFIDATFSVGLAHSDLRARAIEALDRRDEDYLDYARFKAYLNEWKDRDGAKEFALAYHAKLLTPFVDGKTYVDWASKIEQIFGMPGYTYEASEAVPEALKARLLDSPDDYKISAQVIGSIPVSEKRAMWETMLVLGSRNPRVWSDGHFVTVLERGSADFEALMPYVRNTVFYANYNPNKLDYATYQLHGMIGGNGWHHVPEGMPEPDMEAVRKQVICPYYRVARLQTAICLQETGDRNCGTRGAINRYGNELLDEVQRKGLCRKERQAQLQDLVFSPVPVEAFLAD